MMPSWTSKAGLGCTRGVSLLTPLVYGEILPVSLILGALGVVEIHQLYVWVTEGDFIFPSPKDLTSDKLKGFHY